MNQRNCHQYIEAFSQAASVEEIHAACSSLCRDFGFDHFIYGARIPTSLVKPSIFIINGFPTAWWEHYKHSGYMEIDPVVAHCSQQIHPLIWSYSRPPGGDAPHVRRFMGEARDHGLKNGASFPLHCPQGDFALLSLTSENPPPKSTSRPAEAIPFVHLLTTYLHEAVRRVVEIREIPATRKPLTQREKECLLWAAEGKSSWETSMILGISERTVVFHLQNATAKMGVANRQHAVARAISLGIVAPQFG